MAAIAILRSSQRNIRHVDALRQSAVGRGVSDGLLHRSLAVLRDNPNASGAITDPAVTMAGARSELTPLSPTQTRIQVLLYAGSTTPAVDIVIDPTSL